MIISCGKCGTAWAEERYGVCPTCGSAKFKMTDLQETTDNRQQFEQRCWELFVAAWPTCVNEPQHVLEDTVKAVQKFERKMKEPQDTNKAGMTCGECGAFYEGYSLPRQNLKRMQQKNAVEEADFHKRMAELKEKGE